MHFEKSTHAAASSIGRHVHRLLKNDKNTDIDIARTKKFNLCITPYIKEVNGVICDISKMNIHPSDEVKPITRDNYFENRALIQKLEYQHYKDRKSELFCYNRKDIKTLVNAVITLPQELTDSKDIDKFFSQTVSFFSERYGSENLISAVRNFDESNHGREHIHVSFIPAFKIDYEKLMKKKNHVKAMENFKEKISAYDVISDYDIKTVHNDFQEYIDRSGLKCCVTNKPVGLGKSINLSVAQLKELTQKTGITLNKSITLEEFAGMISHNRDIEIIDSSLKEKVANLEKENIALHEKVKTLEKQLELQHSHSFRESQSSWGHSRNNGWTSSRELEVDRRW